MKNRTAILLSAVLWFAIGAAQAQAPRTWIKTKLTAVSDSQTVGTWVSIATADGQFPFHSRRLYKDATGRKLVLRAEFTGNGSSNVSITSLDTQETLSFEKVHGSTLTLVFGSQEVELLREDFVAAVGESGTDFPVAMKTSTRALIAGASAAFETDLYKLAQVGCFASRDLTPFTVLYAQLFYDDVACHTLASRASESIVGEATKNFDPAVHPPNAFEQEFGSAYYE
jgi:hypothetical protein